MSWTLDKALKLICKIRPECEEAGYYVALAGNALMAGEIENQLDLVMMPQHSNADPDALRLKLVTAFNCVAKGHMPVVNFVPGATRWAFLYGKSGKQLIRVAVVDGSLPRMKVICKDNFDRDHVPDRLICEDVDPFMGDKIARLLNDRDGDDSPEYFKMVPHSYKLKTFEP
jgi:hypothetical protein